VLLVMDHQQGLEDVHAATYVRESLVHPCLGSEEAPEEESKLNWAKDCPLMQNVSDKPATEAWRFTMASTSAAVRTCPHDGMVILIGVLSRARHGEATTHRVELLG
jgi:hypothetical protein